MDDVFTKRVRTAAVAGWWTVLILWVLMLISWAFFEVIMAVRPGWLLVWLGGGDLDWLTVQKWWLTLFGVFKLCALMVLTTAVWLSLWGCRLKRCE